MRNRRRKKHAAPVRAVTREEFIAAWELAEEMGMPEAAAAYWAHEYCGLEYGDGFDLLTEDSAALSHSQEGNT